MTPNDKLPEVITNQIESNASLISGYKKDEDPTPQRSGYYFGYIAGATAWAIWKVKHDEVKADFERVQKNCLHYANRKDEVEKKRDLYKEQAQAMADALEAWIKADDKLTVAINAGHVHYAAEYQGEVEKCMVVLKEQVQQFKDGTKGKEVGDA